MTKKPDFRVFALGSVWRIMALSVAAKEFAEEFFMDVQGWQGARADFTTDWRIGRSLADELVSNEAFDVEVVF